MKPLFIIPLGLLFVVAGTFTGYQDYKASIPDYPRDGVPLSAQRDYDSLYRSAEDQDMVVQLERCQSRNALNTHLTIYAVSSTYSYSGTNISYYNDKGTFITSDYHYDEYDDVMTKNYEDPEVDITSYTCQTLSSLGVD